MIGWLRRLWRSLRPGTGVIEVDRPVGPRPPPPPPPWPPYAEPPRPPRDREVACPSTHWSGIGRTARKWKCTVKGEHETHRSVGGKHWWHD